ncbi:MAG TPA: alcohol dehydrogenase [Deltaproteobacteria bacterium]|nr:alcohol dehydrogenase [Deltaproteobacteria bacterium]
MRALHYHRESGLRLLSDYPVPVPEPGEALVRVTLAGICATDLEITRGYMDFAGVPGHEFVGVVEKAADRFMEGRRVVGEINISCRRCGLCRRGLSAHCPDRKVLGIAGKDGALAEYLTLPVENLHVVDDGVDDEEAVFTEPLAAAFEILEQTDVGEDDRVLVMGDGRLGLLAAQVLALRSRRVVCAGRHGDKLSILETRGIETTADGAELMRRGHRFDVVVECTGRPAGVAEALRYVRPRGTVVVKTTVAARREADLNRLVIDEITLLGSRCGPFEPALRALTQGLVEVKALVSRRTGLAGGVEAFEKASAKGVIKVLVEM